MKVVGLITEYNPFHNGHKYHLAKAKEITDSDYVVVVMSGNFVQRGTPAITDKYTRTKMALSQGADLVVELPVCFATGSAEYFAFGAISTLNSLGIVDSLCFGSECGDINVLSSIADLLLTEPPVFKQSIIQSVKSGTSYPIARMNAILSHFDQLQDSPLAKVLASPNNILGIEYLKALKRLQSYITPYTIHRKGNSYHDTMLAQNAFNSATAIRTSYYTGETLTAFQNNIPTEVFDILSEVEKQSFPIHENDCSDLLYLNLLQKSTSDLSDFLDSSEDLAKRIKNNLPFYLNFSSFAMLLKTKQYTLTRINRVLIHILLGIKPNDSSSQAVPYIRILGLRKEASCMINNKTTINQVPIITKISNAKDMLSESGMSMLKQDIFATDLYNRLIYSKFNVILKNEYQHGILII